MHLDLVTFIVDEYDPAIEFFVDVLGFVLAEDSPSLTNDGRPKRWVVVRPPGDSAGLLLARADGEVQEAAIGRKAAGRVAFFLRTDDFDARHQRLQAHGIEMAGPVRDEEYGRLVVFIDPWGNKWDLLGPAPAPSAS